MPEISTREEVYKAIDGERDYQQRRWLFADDRLANEFMMYLEEYTAKARSALHEGGTKEWLPVVRKIAALAVVSMECHGAPKREEEKDDQ